ncbi:MAG: glycosyltransferase [Eubacterium sp.]|nr:glycosyltransferase [Eubacterium sp.]
MAATKRKEERMIRIAHFGAYDLESLGDTMFPVIFRMEMKERFGDRLDIDLYSPNGTSHSYNNLERVYPIDSLPQRHAKEPYRALVIGGGEFIHFLPVKYKSPEGEKKQYLAGELWKKPQEIAAGLNIPVIWNCVGVGRDFENNGEAEQIRQACEALCGLSVRDAYSRIRLEKFAGVQNVLQVPDMLWMFPRHIKEASLDDCFGQLKKEYRFLNQDYLALQYGTSLEYEKLAKEVQKISTDYGLAVLLVTVNYCHEDQEVAYKIQKVCRDFYVLGRKLQPKEIMAVISHAKFFLGTTLHGNITAMSYGVKNLCLDMYPSCVGKLDGLFAMMQMEELLVKDVDSLRIQFDQQMHTDHREMIAKKAALFQEQLKCHFDRIASLLQDGVRKQKEDAKAATDRMEEDRELQRRQCRLIKSVLNNGNISTGCNSIMEGSGALDEGGSLKLEFQVQSTGAPYHGKFYYPNPFIIESIEASENGRQASCSLEGMVTGSGEGSALYKDCCIFSVCPDDTDASGDDISKEEVCGQEALIQVRIWLREAWREYIEALEGQARRDAQKLLNKKGHIELLLESERKLEAETQEKQRQVSELLEEGQKLQRDLEKKQECLDASAQETEHLKQELKRKQECLDTYRRAEKKKERELKSRREYLEACKQAEQELRQELLNKQGHIELLLESEREFERVKKSRTWRLAFRMQQLSAFLLPPGSGRRLAAKMAVRLLRHPRQSLKLLSPRKIRHFFHFLKEEGAGFVSQRIDESMRGVHVAQEELNIREGTYTKPFEEYDTLIFQQAGKPQVSIIIPVFNEFAYTYRCLQSILEQTGDKVSYEVIVADDASTDDTVRLQEAVKNIRIIRNAQNLRFLKNCNHAAESACGKYLLFLNNDTQVQENWLEPLVRLMEERQDAGITGSKLVYADGRLQEAGGIVWDDASAWNYGNRMDPARPEFNYVKEADYISGAALMVRAALWREIGGFDKRFAPAYYEDTDLAFEARKHGYKVLYQPQSVVVHFEGVSNGKDISAGQKAYQEKNQAKFFEKWKGVLAKRHFPNGKRVFLARDRARGKKTLLVVDHYVPTYDKDAGSRCIFDYLKLFVSAGYNVKFIGDNFYKSEPYTTVLQQMGIEVLYGDYYYRNWKSWIKENGKYFDYVLLSRPHISIKYIDMIREYSHAKVIYFGHDLHFLREMREYRLTRNEQARKDAIEWKKTELLLMRKADVSYYLSQAELSEIAKLDTSVKVRRVPIHIYQNTPKADYHASDRQGLLFVGGFGHPPNTDAVQWLVTEVMPLIWEKNAGIVLHVVGQNPPQEIRELASEKVLIHGFVPQEELEEMYRKVRLAVVPLRFGAGVKGKIIEGMLRGVPIVTTEIGIEGIEGAEQIVKACEGAEKIAEAVVRLYEDYSGLEKMSQEEWQYVMGHFSVECAVEILREDFEFSHVESEGMERK